MPQQPGGYVWQPDEPDEADTPTTPTPTAGHPWLAGGLRGLSGLLSGAVAMEPGLGTALGSGIAGAGEYGAELLEGSEPSWKRIGTEAALGAVPGGKLLKSGSFFGSALRGGAFSGLGAAMRQGAAGQGLDPWEIGKQAAIGGVISGGIGKLLGVGDHTVSPGAEPTAPLPGGLRTGTAGEPIPPPPPAPPMRPGRTSTGTSFGTVQAPPRSPIGAPRSPVQPLGQPPAPPETNPFVARAVAASEKGAPKAVTPLEELLTPKPVVPPEPFNPPRMAEPVPTPPPTPAGFDQPGLGPVFQTAEGSTISRGPMPEMTDEEFIAATRRPTTPGVARSAAEPPTELSRLLKTPEDIAEQTGVTTGQRPYTPGQVVASPPEGIVLSSIEGSPEGKLNWNRAEFGPETAPSTPSTGTVPSAKPGVRPKGKLYGTETVTPEEKLAGAAGSRPFTEAEIAEELASIAQKSGKGRSFIDRLKDSGGGIDPTLAARLGLGAAGALIGGATDPLGNPLLSAAAGAGIGALTPSAIHTLKDIGIPDVSNMSIDDIRQKVPQMMRFNYLVSGIGLPANAWVGPYGSAVMGALEHGLSGDPRGWAALRELKNPYSFFKTAISPGATQEAGGLIGRAEGQSMSSASTLTQKALAAPGTLMTAGDVTARKILMRAGFTEDEARRITLTGEPELRPAKRMAGFTKGSPELQTVMPFSRTPANILEQGAMRIPGLGRLMQQQRAIPDSMRQQLVQQGLGLGVGVGSAALGANLDPESAKIARRYVSNAAGQYSLPASIGFAAGQALQKGKNPVSGALNEMAYALPLPTVEPMAELSKFISDPQIKTLPRWSYPSIFREGIPLGFPGLSDSEPASTASPVEDLTQPSGQRYIWNP